MKTITTSQKAVLPFYVLLVSLLFCSISYAQAPNLGAAASFGVFSGGSGQISSTSNTIISGDVGSETGNLIGLVLGQISGSLHLGDALSHTVETDLVNALNSLASLPCDITLSANIAKQTLNARIYCTSGAATISGDLTLDAGGNPNAIFIFKMGGGLTIDPSVKINLTNGARAANIFWKVSGDINAGNTSVLCGTFLTNQAINIGDGAVVDGRMLSAGDNVHLGSLILTVPSLASMPPAHNYVFAAPSAGDNLVSGSVYQILFSSYTPRPDKTLEYSIDGGASWHLIAVIADPNTNSLSWNVPNTPANTGLVRIRDNSGDTVTSGIFSIKSQNPGTIAIYRPANGETINGGTQNYQIIFNGAGLASLKTFSYSLDAGVSWNTMGTTSGSESSFSWNVPNIGTSKAVVRITDGNGATGTSGMFTIIQGSSPFLIFTHPASGEVVLGGTQNYQITWTGSGIAQQKMFDYTIDGGVTWNSIGTINSDATSLSWNVPNPSSTGGAMLRMIDANGLMAVCNIFTLQSTGPGTPTFSHPAVGEIIPGGTMNYAINYSSGEGLTPPKIFTYSLDGGASWNILGFQNDNNPYFSWSQVPNVATTQGLIRITDRNGTSGTGGPFTITATPGVGSINSLYLGGLVNGNIGNNQPLYIYWTFTPDIGTSVDVQYATGDAMSWIPITTVQVSESGNSASATWMTPATGVFRSDYIRLVSSNGVSRISQPFSIGAVSSVTNGTSYGYSVTSYPNPANDITNVRFELPRSSDVTLKIYDDLGREIITHVLQHYEGGSHSIPVVTTNLTAGAYTYELQTSAVIVIGKMIVVK